MPRKTHFASSPPKRAPTEPPVVRRTSILTTCEFARHSALLGGRWGKIVAHFFGQDHSEGGALKIVVIAEITDREALLVNELGAADPSSAVLPYGEVCPLLHESHPSGLASQTPPHVLRL